MLDRVTAGDIDQLMTWFPDARSVNLWGGPKFRYPFTRETFFSDCRWQEFSTYCLRDDDGRMTAFGQLGSRYERSHLARLVAHPDRRGQGIGRRLITLLIEKVQLDHGSTECGLFVYKDNVVAYQCYLSLGFKAHPYPDNAAMPDKCLYLTKVI